MLQWKLYNEFYKCQVCDESFAKDFAYHWKDFKNTIGSVYEITSPFSCKFCNENNTNNFVQLIGSIYEMNKQFSCKIYDEFVLKHITDWRNCQIIDELFIFF